MTGNEEGGCIRTEGHCLRCLTWHTVSPERGRPTRQPMVAGASPVLVTWAVAEPWGSLAVWPWASPRSLRFSAKWRWCLIENVSITFVAYFLKSEGGTFVLPSSHLSRSAGSQLGLLTRFPHFLSSPFPFPAGNKKVGPQGDRGYTREWKRKVSTRTLCRGDFFFQVY